MMATPGELLTRIDRIHALKISQKAVARGIGAHSGDVSRVLRGIVTSAPMTRRIDAFLDAREEELLVAIRPATGRKG
jgi:plasmid maintenance system antidote protein VapI